MRRDTAGLGWEEKADQGDEETALPVQAGGPPSPLRVMLDLCASLAQLTGESCCEQPSHTRSFQILQEPVIKNLELLFSMSLSEGGDTFSVSYDLSHLQPFQVQLDSIDRDGESYPFPQLRDHADDLALKI